MCNRKQHIQAETVYHIPRCDRQKITYRYINKIYCLRIAFRYQPWTTNDVQILVKRVKFYIESMEIYTTEGMTTKKAISR